MHIINRLARAFKLKKITYAVELCLNSAAGQWLLYAQISSS